MDRHLRRFHVQWILSLVVILGRIGVRRILVSPFPLSRPLRRDFSSRQPDKRVATKFPVIRTASSGEIKESLAEVKSRSTRLN